MKHSLWLILIIVLALGKLSAESWTVLVYMAADNNLASHAKIDINSMESAVQPENLNLIVQADLPEGAKRYRITKDNSPIITSPVLQNLGNIDSGDYNTLTSFINWGFAAYPADRKMLVIWSHGNSWYKSDDSKWICTDDGSQSRISVYNGDLARAFAGTPHLDILMFDACSMQGIEVLTEVYEYADYVIGSADLVPVNGFPYETIIPLFSGSLESILTQIPELYVESYLPWGVLNPGPYNWTIMCSTIKMAGIPEFVAKFKHFSEYYRDNHRDSRLDLNAIRQQCFSMNDGMSDVDLREFLTRTAEAGSWCMTNLAVELRDLWNNMVINSAFTTPQPYSNIGTAAIWFPDFRLNFDWGWERYIQLQFAKTKWLRVLNLILIDSVPPALPVLLAKKVENNRLILQIQAPTDPDSLSYELWIIEGNHTHATCIRKSEAEKTFVVTAPITMFGRYRFYAIDQNYNRSFIEGEYSFSSVSISPNPVRNTHLATLHWLAGEDVSGALTLDVFNIRGQKVFSRELGKVSFGAGSYPLFADDKFKSLAAGRYIIRLSMGNKHLSEKLTILH